MIALLLSVQHLNAYTEKEIQSIISKNESLKQDDADLNIVYSILKDFSSHEEKQTLLRDQQEWLRTRNQTTTEKALQSSYHDRIALLKTRIKKKEDPIMSQILVGEPKIDFAKAEELVKACPTMACQGYAIYFQAQKISNPDEKKKFMEEKFLNLLAKFDPSFKNKSNEEALLRDVVVEIANCKDCILPKERQEIPMVTVPLWLYLKEEEIQKYDTGTCYNPYGVDVISTDNIENIPDYDAFAALLKDLSVHHWQLSGTIRQTIGSYHCRLRDYLSYTPKHLSLPDPENPATDYSLNSPSLEKWAFLGPWNFKKYNDFKKSFEKMAEGLKGYYEAYDHLDKYALYATDYLNEYVSEIYGQDIQLASNQAFEVFKKPGRPLPEIKGAVQDFSERDLNAALSYAILNNYGTDVLDLLIGLGANVNGKVDDETPLMKASNRPDILKHLLSKGAKIDETTGFGKTALFYAIQFNNLESVKVLVEKGAKLNVNLIRERDKGDGFDLNETLGFKPLAYSMRYGSVELTNYLVKKGATLKDVPLKTVEAWVNKADEDNRYKTHLELIKKSGIYSP